MTSPQDPNQPGWSQQPGAPQPWGAPPAGSPPPGTPPPGWGQPQPGWDQPGWGQPQPGWGPPPAQPRSFARRHGCLLAFLVALGVILVLVVGCVVTMGPTIGMDLKLLADLQPRANQVEFQWANGGTTWVIHVAPGHGSEAVDMACHVVKPDLAGTQFANSPFKLVDSQGYILADETTPCS